MLRLICGCCFYYRPNEQDESFITSFEIVIASYNVARSTHQRTGDGPQSVNHACIYGAEVMTSLAPRLRWYHRRTSVQEEMGFSKFLGKTVLESSSAGYVGGGDAFSTVEWGCIGSCSCELKQLDACKLFES